MLVKDHHVQMHQVLAKDLEAKGNLTLKPMKKMAAAKKLSAQQQGLLRAFATGALWANARRRAAGYDVPVVCQLFLKEEDTLKHRWYQRTATEVAEERDKVTRKDRNFLERATGPQNKELFEQSLVGVPRN